MTDHSDLIERARAYRPYNHLNDGDLVRQLLEALSSQSLSLSEARAENDRKDAEIERLKGLVADPQEPSVVEAVAREIDPGVFRNHESLYNYCLRSGDSHEEALKTATWAHPIAPAFDRARAVILAYRSALENGPAVLADAHSKSPDPSLSSLRKGAEVAAIMEMFGRWQSGYAFNDDNDDDVDLESRVEGEIAALVSGSREEQS